MNESLEKLQKKYTLERVQGEEQGPADRSASDEEPDICEFHPDAKGWRGCASICLLKYYLAENPSLGASIGLDVDGWLKMRFSPPFGFDDDNGERLRAAVQAVELLVDAKEDILRLVDEGSMRLKMFS